MNKKNAKTLKKTFFAAVLAAAALMAVPGMDAQAAVKLNKTVVTVKVGKSVTLKLKGTAKKVKWASNKKTVAAVTQKGKVTGKKAGKAVITAKAGKKTYKCKVTVKVVKAAETPNAKDDAVTDNIVTDENTVTDSTGTTVSGSTETQAPAQGTEVTAPAHTHDYIPHYSYDGSGNPIKDAYFCSDVACSENRGYGTDDGWRGEKAPGYTTEFGYGTGNAGNTGSTGNAGNAGSTQPPVSGNTGNGAAGSTGTETQKPEEKPADTENKEPVQEEEQPAAHAHSWTVPVMSADGTAVDGYRCAGCGKTSHRHAWDTAVKVESGFSAGALNGWKCACGEEISTEDYDKLTKANKDAAAQIRKAWIAKNITAGMSDLEKARKALLEITTWEYAASPAYEEPEISHKSACAGGNETFAAFCKDMGINAEVFAAYEYTGENDHFMTYVYVNGEKLVADATPGGNGCMGTTGEMWTEDGFWTYCDLCDGIITTDEFVEKIEQCIR